MTILVIVIVLVILFTSILCMHILKKEYLPMLKELERSRKVLDNNRNNEIWKLGKKS